MVGYSPPDIGRVAATSIRSREASFNGADGVVQSGATFQERILKHFVNPKHPVCAAAVASHLFLDGAATPPVSGRGIASLTSVRSFYFRACNRSFQPLSVLQSNRVTVMEPNRIHARQVDLHLKPGIEVLRVNLSCMAFDSALGDGEPQSGSPS